MARPRTFDPERILDGAVQLFREKGFGGTNVPELITRLGICRQSLYNEFGDKRGLYLAALERYGQKEVEARLALLESEGSPLENVRTVLRGLASLATQCPGDGCLTAIAIVEIRDDPEALAVVERQVERLEDGFRQALERALAAGELVPETRCERLARSIVSTIYGIGLLSRLPGSGKRIADSVSTLLASLEACVRK